MRTAVVLLLLVLSGCSSYTLVAQQGSTEYVPGTDTPTYTFNGTVPGPTLHASVGEPFTAVVKNTLREPITVHWHGVRVPNEMDGVPDVTQEPIPPGGDFAYEFTPQDPGVFWYHSHVEAHKQVEMGLQGVLIVDDPDTTIQSDSDHVLVVDDVAVQEDGSYNSFDLNYMHGRFGNVLLVNGEQRPTIRSQGERHRFRIVNTANARTFNLYFGGNPVTVYSEDIGYVDPYKTKTVTVHSGERFDVVVDADESFDILHISRQNALMARVEVSPLYASRPAVSDTPAAPAVSDSLYEQEPDMVLSLRGVRDAEHGLVWQINGTDTLTNPGEFSLDSVTKLRLVNTQGQVHPMHLHGQKFVILSRNGVRQSNEGFKDTVMVGSNEVVDLAVFADNPGEWVFHCHILEHARAGMLATMHVDAKEI